MKKLYFLSLLTGAAFSINAAAQCNITSATVTPSGLTVNATMTASGATVAGYGWSWGDSQVSTSQTASHTYASAGTYTVCAVYVDLANTSCGDRSCQVITVTAVGIKEPQTPTVSVQAVPNPFSSAINVHLTLNQPQNVEVTVYNMTGQKVATLQNGPMNAGNNTVTWEPAGVAEGVYFLQVRSGENVLTKKIVYANQ